MKGYTALILTPQSKDKIQEHFQPKYVKFIGHHVTIQFGVKEYNVNRGAESIVNGDDLPDSVDAHVVGYVDSGNGLEALIVSVNGTTIRPDGGTYHITWSLDPGIYKPKDSNNLIQEKGWKEISNNIRIDVSPEFIPFKQ